MTIRAVLFDLDGTLIDSLEDIAGSMNGALLDLGQPGHALDAYRDFVGDGVHALARRALPPGAGDDLRDAAVIAFRRRYGARLLERTRPYAGIADLLDALVARGVALGVVTNKPEPAARTLMERLFARWSWGAVIGDLAGLPKKPDPAGALAAARALGVAPAEALFVGDTAVDVRTGKNAGMVAVGVLWGFRPRAELEAAGADHIIGEPGALLRLVPPGNDVSAFRP